MEYITTPAQAEQNAAAQMRALGYLDARAVSGGPDGGVDVRSKRALAQVKCKPSLAGRPELQNLFGARGSDYGKELWYFVASGYSEHAMAYAEEHSILLFTYGVTGTLAPANRHAGEKLRQIEMSNRADAAPSRPGPSAAELRSRERAETLLREKEAASAVKVLVGLGVLATIASVVFMLSSIGGDLPNFIVGLVLFIIGVIVLAVAFTGKTKPRW